MTRIHKYPTNQFRDIVLGDIHGNFEVASAALKALNIRRGDRVFTVGDIVNRGSDSLKCFESFSATSVRGNHEQLILSYWKGLEKGQGVKEKLLRAGGGWFLKLNKDYQKEVIYRIKNMPTAIQVGEENPYVIVHACLPASWKEAKKLIPTSPSFRKRIHCEHGFYSTSSEELIKESSKGVRAIFVGHDRVPEIKKHYGKIYQLDTGVYRTGKLSFAIIENGNIRTGTYVSMTQGIGT